MYANSLFVLFLVKVTAGADGDEDTCVKLLDAENNDCCDSLKIFKSLDEAEEACLKEDLKEMTCDDFKCILDKKGLVKGDNLDEDAAKVFFAAIAEEYPGEKDVVKKIESKCYKQRDSDGDCPFETFLGCAYALTLLECTSWKDTPQCQKMSNDAMKCKGFVNE